MLTGKEKIVEEREISQRMVGNTFSQDGDDLVATIENSFIPKMGAIVDASRAINQATTVDGVDEDGYSFTSDIISAMQRKGFPIANLNTTFCIGSILTLGIQKFLQNDLNTTFCIGSIRQWRADHWSHE